MKYIVTVIGAFVEIGIANAILDDASYSSDGDIMAALVFIYVTIRFVGIGVAMSFHEGLLISLKSNLEIKKAIKPGDEDLELETDDLQKAMDKSHVMSKKHVIRAIGLFIIYIVALMNLLD